MQPGHLRKGMRQNFRQQILYRVGYFTLILEIASWIIIAGPTEKVQAATAEKMMAARMTDQTETGSRNEEDQTTAPKIAFQVRQMGQDLRHLRSMYINLA